MWSWLRWHIDFPQVDSIARRELITYTTVVVAFVTVLMFFVAVLDVPKQYVCASTSGLSRYAS